MADTLKKKDSHEMFVEPPDISHIQTEDDSPVDNIFSEKQQRLLTETLNNSWKPGRPFVAFANVGIFNSIDQPPIVPDVFLSMDVQPAEDLWEKKNRSYFVWEFGKPPEVVIEIVSNTKGGENGVKMEKYARIGVRYYAIFDPCRQIQKDELRIYECTLDRFFPKIDRIMPTLNLGFIVWEGVYEGKYDRWLRWIDADGELIPTGAECVAAEKELVEQEKAIAARERSRAAREKARAEQERLIAAREKARAEQERSIAAREKARAEQERSRAEREKAKAEEERSRAERAEAGARLMAEKLESLGIDPKIFLKS